MKDLDAKIILIAKLYEFKAKQMMNVLDQLIKTSRVTRMNDVSIVFKSTKRIKKLKEMTTRLKKIVKKKKTYQKKSNTWATIARRKVAMTRFNVDAKKTSIFFSKRELKIAIKVIEQKRNSNDTKNDVERDCEKDTRHRDKAEFAKKHIDNTMSLWKNHRAQDQQWEITQNIEKR